MTIIICFILVADIVADYTQINSYHCYKSMLVLNYNSIVTRMPMLKPVIIAMDPEEKDMQSNLEN